MIDIKNKHLAIIFILIPATLSTVFGQRELSDNMIADSLVQQFGIRQVTENWYITDSTIANTTYEIYDESGYRIQRVHINYSYHKFIQDYSYDFKKGIIIEAEKYYDWNSKRKKSKGDTILEKSLTKYDLITRHNIKFKPSKLNDFKIQLIYDNIGRVMQSKDSIKFGYTITKYAYGMNGKVSERKHYLTRHSENPNLESADSLFYNHNGLLYKEINYYNFKQHETEIKHGKEVETIYEYNNNGLMIEKVIRTKRLFLGDLKSDISIYKYIYEFYE